MNDGSVALLFQTTGGGAHLAFQSNRSSKLAASPGDAMRLITPATLIIPTLNVSGPAGLGQAGRDGPYSKNARPSKPWPDSPPTLLANYIIMSNNTMY